MKFLKRFFSKIFVSALLFLLQLSLFFGALFFLNEYFVVFQILSGTLAVLVFFYVVTKKEPPEFKLPWLILLFVFPFFGLFLYLLFANPKIPKKQGKRLQAITKRTRECLTLQKTESEKTQAYLGSFSGVTGYLDNTSYLHGHLNNRISYFSVGEDFWQDLLSELAKAEKFIFMEYFIIANGTMWDSIHKILQEKAAQGVEVRVLYDDIGSVGLLEGSFCKKLQKEGIQCHNFNPFRPVLSGIFNNRDHRKITVIDGKVGYTGGINLGDEYVNLDHRLGHWKDTAIKIEGSAVRNLCAMFLHLYDMNCNTVSDYERYLLAPCETFAEEGYVQPFGDGPKPYYSEQIGENNYLHLIYRAERYVYITTPYLILDYNLLSALRNAALRGVDVRIVTPHIPDKKLILNMTRSNYPHLLQAGVKIYEYTPGFIHAKSLVADDEYAFVGTINFDYRSLVHHYECGALLYKTPCIREIKADMDKTIAVSQEITQENFHLSRFARMINAIMNLFTPML